MRERLCVKKHFLFVRMSGRKFLANKYYMELYDSTLTMMYHTLTLFCVTKFRRFVIVTSRNCYFRELLLSGNEKATSQKLCSECLVHGTEVHVNNDMA